MADFTDRIRDFIRGCGHRNLQYFLYDYEDQIEFLIEAATEIFTTKMHLVLECSVDEEVVLLCGLRDFYQHTGEGHLLGKEGEYEKLALVCPVLRDFIFNDVGVKNIISVTPKPFRHVISYLKNVGFKEKMVLKDAAYIASKDEYKDCVVMLCQNEE